MLAMIAYHFCFDLRWFGYARWDFEHDGRWIAARSAILGTFLLLAGMSLVLAQRRPAPARAFARHVAGIAAAALLVTAASYAAFPATFIRFGVLHAIAVSLVLALPLTGRPRLALVLGVIVVLAGLLVSHPAFDANALNWIGFAPRRPAAEDYVPLFPWTGGLLVGVALGSVPARRRSTWLRPFARLPDALARLGQHGLVVYLVHQPVLIGLLWLAARSGATP